MIIFGSYSLQLFRVFDDGCRMQPYWCLRPESNCLGLMVRWFDVMVFSPNPLVTDLTGYCTNDAWVPVGAFIAHDPNRPYIRKDCKWLHICRSSPFSSSSLTIKSASWSVATPGVTSQWFSHRGKVRNGCLCTISLVGRVPFLLLVLRL